MDSMNLKDFRPAGNPDGTAYETATEDLEDSEDNLSGTGYHEEVNTIKIDKLSNKVTIISIIIPVMIGAILVFAYQDMKERVVDVDQTKQHEVDKISQQFEEKLNSLDVKIAKNKFEIDNTLPQIQKKNIALEGQLAKVSSSKADAKTIKAQLSKLNKQVNNNTSQNKSTITAIEKMNQATLSTINTNQEQFDKTSTQIKEEITLFKEEFDARLLELSDYEEQIGLARKDLSLLDKKYKVFEREHLTKTQYQTESKELQTELSQLKTTQDKQMRELKLGLSQLKNKIATETAMLSKRIEKLSKSQSAAPKGVQPVGQNKPKPQVISETPTTEKITQKPLNQ